MEPWRAHCVKPTPHKLDSVAQAVLLQALAEYCTYEQAVERVTAQAGITITRQAAWFHVQTPERQARIRQLRDAWTRRLGDEAMANKAFRLRELRRLYDANVREGARRDALAVLEAIRRELEGPDRGPVAGAEIRLVLGDVVARALAGQPARQVQAMPIQEISAGEIPQGIVVEALDDGSVSQDIVVEVEGEEELPGGEG